MNPMNAGMMNPMQSPVDPRGEQLKQLMMIMAALGPQAGNNVMGQGGMGQPGMMQPPMQMAAGGNQNANAYGSYATEGWPKPAGWPNPPR